MAKTNFELLCDNVEVELRKNHDRKFYCDRREFDGKNKFMWISTQDGNIGGCVCHYELRLENDNDNDEDNQNIQEKVYVEFHIEQEHKNKTTSLVEVLVDEINKSLCKNSQLILISCQSSLYHWYRRTVSNVVFPLCCDVNNISAIVGELVELDKLVNGTIKKVFA